MPFALKKILRLIVISILLALPIAIPWSEAQNETSSGSLQFNYAFVALTNAGDRPQLVPVGSSHLMRSGDRLKLYIEALSECYFYLFHIGPGGILQRIFPLSPQKARLPIEREISIPEGDKWLELDSETGMEKFYLIASEIRQEHLENLFQQYLSLKDNSAAAQTARNRIIEEITIIRRKNLSTNAERPVRIGGSFRGPASITSTPGLNINQLASKVDTNGTYSRFFTIDHQ